jgi:hypothetical protein
MHGTNVKIKKNIYIYIYIYIYTLTRIGSGSCRELYPGVPMYFEQPVIKILHLMHYIVLWCQLKSRSVRLLSTDTPNVTEVILLHVRLLW